MYKNSEMERMLDTLKPHLERRDIIGYGAARNARVLRDELSEYTKVRNELIMKYGEADLDDDGNPTGTVSLALDSPRFADFSDEIAKFATIEHDPSIFKLKFEEAIGQLSGSELLEIEWMFED